MLPNARGIIKESFLLYKKDFKIFLPFVLLVIIPYTLMSLAPIANVFVISILTNMMDGIKATKLLSLALIGVIYVVLSIFVLWITTALTKRINERSTGNATGATLSVKEEFNLAKKYLWPLITTGILTILILIGGTILFVIPGIIFGLWFAFASLAVILDDKRGMPALKYSKSLVAGRWWGVFWRLLAPTLLIGFVTYILEMIILFPFGFLTFYADSLLITSLTIIVSMTISAFLMPLSMSVPIILYRELKNSRVESAPMPSIPQA
ncbi:MAG: hypothetical protein AAB390_02445 [Patescibacteria group bacterium]